MKEKGRVIILSFFLLNRKFFDFFVRYVFELGGLKELEVLKAVDRVN